MDTEQLISELIKDTDHKTLALWAADCAERALPIFREKYPQEDVPGKAIAAARDWVSGKIDKRTARRAAFASHAAARNVAETPEAIAAARSTGHAAATAHVHKHALPAADYALKAIEAKSGPEAVKAERNWQYNRLIKLNSESK
jgi:hypothetical protein